MAVVQQHVHFLFFLILTLLIDFVSQNATAIANGSQSNPFPNMTTALEATTDFQVTLVLFYSDGPYEFFDFFYSNLNLTIE